MIKRLLEKWFGLESETCQSCELLRSQLDESNRERRELLNRLLTKDSPEPPPIVEDKEIKPITPTHLPWRVRQQMLENEDRRAAQILREKEKEIAETKVDPSIEKLETELGIKGA